MSSRQFVPVRRQSVPVSTPTDSDITPTSTYPSTDSIVDTTTASTAETYTDTPTSFPTSTASTQTSLSISSYPTFTPAQTSTATPTQSPVVAAASSTSETGTIAGCVVGGVLFLVLALLAILLYLRVRKRRRTPPSAEFMNSHRAGIAPVPRLDSGAEYTPTFLEKSTAHTHYPPTVPVPFLENSYYTSPLMQDMRYPDELMVTDRPSAENTLHPQRYSSQTNDVQHNPSTSIGSRRELWGSETEMVSSESSPVRLSPLRADTVLQFAPRFSLDEPSSQPSYLSHSPPSLQPLRRQPE